jgi:hypothetical protein
MPRRNAPKRAKRASDGDDVERPVSLGSAAHAPVGWNARTIQPTNATKRYVCPGCEAAIDAGTKHLVAWPSEAESHRRHWHEHCWRAAVRSGRRLPT